MASQSESATGVGQAGAGVTERRPGKKTAGDIASTKGGDKLVMLAAYDVLTARLAEAAGIDLLLVGDSLGQVVLGYGSTVPVTIEEILHHTRAVVRGAPNTHVVADMPFLTFSIETTEAIRNAGRLLKEGGADSVKIEAGRAQAERVKAVIDAGIPVMGHVGLTPQTAGSLGGLRVQGRDLARAREILDDAVALEQAGVFAIVIEAVPTELGTLISRRVRVPTIGIGAGPGTDGQVLVAADLLGIEDRVSPRFVKRYADLGRLTHDAFTAFASEVRSGDFPGPEHGYPMKVEIAEALLAELPADPTR